MQLPHTKVAGVPSRPASTPAAPASASANTRPPSNIQKHLRKAAGSKDPTILPTFLQTHPSLNLSDLNDATHDGRAALHMACWTGAISNVSLLITMGCDINAIATKPGNYGKTPVFFAATRSREDVVNLMLEEGANVLIVNNKGQSLYTIACSHFGSELVRKIKRVEIEQQGGNNDNLGGWVDYKKTHPDGYVYGDLDLRFLGRPLGEDDVVKDGVVNPTTKESRRGNFTRANPDAVDWRKKKKEEAAKAKKEMKGRASGAPAVVITEEERAGLETNWDQVKVALQESDSGGVFSSLLAIVQFMEGKKMKSRWVVESSSRLEFIVKLEQCLGEIEEGMLFDSRSTEAVDEATSIDLISILSEAIVLCESGDRHATLVKRILTKGGEESAQSRKMPLTEQERGQLDQFWNDTELALKDNMPKDAFVSLIKIVVLLDLKQHSWWLNKSTTKLQSILETESLMEDETVKEVLSFCEKKNNRHTSLLQKMLTNSGNAESDTTEVANQSSKGIDTRTGASRKSKKKARTLPDRYHAIMKTLQERSTEEAALPSLEVLMNSRSSAENADSKHMCLPHPPKWIDSSHDLQSLQTRLHHAIEYSNNKYNGEVKFEQVVGFDSEFRSEGENTKLATIQLSILEDGIPLAWVVDLHPDPADTSYSEMTCDVLRWLFIESNAQMLGFAHCHDLRMISSYIGEEISLSSPRLWDLQVIAANKMSEDKGDGNFMASLPGLKACCSYFLEAGGQCNRSKDDNVRTDWTSWELSKEEQCSSWGQRPLTTSQLEYAGLDAAVLLVLLAEIMGH